MDADSDNIYDPVVLGRVTEFNQEELAQPGTGRVWVRDGLVYYQANECILHHKSVHFVCCASERLFDQIVLPAGQTLETWYSMALKGAPDHYGCTAIKVRCPDGRIEIDAELTAEKYIMLLVEVTFRHLSYRMAPTVGASYMAAWTNLVFILLVIIHEYPGKTGVESLEFILLIRTTQIQSITGAALPGENDCLVEPDIFKESTDAELERALGVRVLKRIRVTRDDVLDPNVDFGFELPLDEYTRLTGNRLQGGPMRADYRACSSRLFRLADQCVAAGTYPDQPRAP